MARRQRNYERTKDAELAELEELRQADGPLKKEVLKLREKQLELAARQKELNRERQAAADAYNRKRDELLAAGANPADLNPPKE